MIIHRIHHPLLLSNRKYYCQCLTSGTILVCEDNLAILILATFQDKLPELPIYGASLLQNETFPAIYHKYVQPTQ